MTTSSDYQGTKCGFQGIAGDSHINSDLPKGKATAQGQPTAAQLMSLSQAMLDSKELSTLQWISIIGIAATSNLVVATVFLISSIVFMGIRYKLEKTIDAMKDTLYRE